MVTIRPSVRVESSGSVQVGANLLLNYYSTDEEGLNLLFNQYYIHFRIVVKRAFE